jgi:hypothetical protein
MIPQPLRDLASDAWDVARDIAGPAGRTARITWRESMRLLRRSLVPGLVERLVGLCIFTMLVAFVVVIMRLVGMLSGAGR